MADQSPSSSPKPGSPPLDSSSAVSVGSNAGENHCENRKRKMEEGDTDNTPESQTLTPLVDEPKIGEEPENPNPNPSPPPPPSPVVGDNKRRLVDDPNPDPPANPPANPPRELFKCNFCHRGFTSPQALGGHQNAHKQDRAFVRHCQRLMNPANDQFGYLNTLMYDRYCNLMQRAYPGSAYGGTGTSVYGRPMMGQMAYGRPPIQWGALGASNNPGLRPETPRPLALPYYAPNDGGRMSVMSNTEQGHVGTSSPASSINGDGNEVQTRDLLRIEEEKKELDLSLKL